MNYKQQDRERILSYLENHRTSTVESIIQGSGAERLRVYPLLFELAQENIIRVIEESEWGAPTKVKFKKDEEMREFDSATFCASQSKDSFSCL